MWTIIQGERNILSSLHSQPLVSSFVWVKICPLYMWLLCLRALNMCVLFVENWVPYQGEKLIELTFSSHGMACLFSFPTDCKIIGLLPNWVWQEKRKSSQKPTSTALGEIYYHHGSKLRVKQLLPTFYSCLELILYEWIQDFFLEEESPTLIPTPPSLNSLSKQNKTKQKKWALLVNNVNYKLGVHSVQQYVAFLLLSSIFCDGEFSYLRSHIINSGKIARSFFHSLYKGK